MSETPASPARRFAQVVLPFVVVGALLWVWFASVKSPQAAPAGTIPIETVPAPEAPADPLASAARLLGTGALRGMMTVVQRAALEEEFGSFMAGNAFTPAQRTRLVGILLDQQAVTMETMLLRMSARLTPEQDAGLMQRMETANTTAVARVEAFFRQEFPADATKHAAFQRYSARLPDRTEVTALQKKFSAAGRELTPAQTEALIEAMYEVRAGVVPALDPEDVSLASLDAETLRRRILDQQRIDRAVAERAAAVIDAGQLEIFRAHQAARLKGLQLLADERAKAPGTETK